METPIYQQLSEERSIDVPAQSDPALDAIAAAPALEWTYAAPDEMPPPRPDGSWCEDRDPAELTDDDGID